VNRAVLLWGLLAGGLVLGLGACRSAPQVRPRNSTLIVSCVPADAEIYVDSRYLGKLSAGPKGFELSVGPHRVEIRREGYFSALHDIRVAAGVDQKLVVELRKMPH
jgi:hypothetical protein